MEIIIRQKAVDALRDSIKIGDHVKYQTEIVDDRPGKVQKEDNDAVIVTKLPHVAMVEYRVKRGRSTVIKMAAITYREIIFQRKGLAW